MPGADWFPGGTLNYAEHALAGLGRGAGGRSGGDRRRGGRQRAAADAGRADGSRSAPRRPGCARLGVGAGDRVVALVPNSVHALVGFLATAAVGRGVVVLLAGFRAPSVIDRFTQISPTVLLAVDGYRYGGREFPVAATVQKIREALPVAGRRRAHRRARHRGAGRHDRAGTS